MMFHIFSVKWSFWSSESGSGAKLFVEMLDPCLPMCKNYFQTERNCLCFSHPYLWTSV